jgi:hypothetical protein
MTTRHVSAENDYPFQLTGLDTARGIDGAGNPVIIPDVDIVAGMLDIYFIIQGKPTRAWDTGSSSSSSAAPELPLIYLSAYKVTDTGFEHAHGDPDHGLLTPHPLGTDTLFVFDAVVGSNVWEIKFRVPNKSSTEKLRLDGEIRDDPGAILGQVYNDDDTDCRAVLVFNSDKIITFGGIGGVIPSLVGWTDPPWGTRTMIPVEPGRAQWHVEQVDDLSFFNIDRCNGVENEDSSWPVVFEEQSSSSGSSNPLYPDIVVDWIDGYNLELEASSGSLELVVAAGIGAGTSPDYGNTGESCSSAGANVLDDAVLVINGVPPINGDIPLATSPEIMIQRSRGLIELVIR